MKTWNKKKNKKNYTIQKRQDLLVETASIAKPFITQLLGECWCDLPSSSFFRSIKQFLVAFMQSVRP